MILGIYGSGGAGKEVKEIAEELHQWSEIVFIDDMVPADIYKGVKRMPFSEFQQTFSIENSEIVIALGETIHKATLYSKVKHAGYQLGTVIHKSAWISPTAILGDGIVLRSGVVINADAQIGNNVTIQENSCVGHDVIIGSHCQIAGLVLIGGHTEIGETTYIGINVSIKDRMKIGSNSVVGMGSVVLRDIPDNVTAIGNPARVAQIRNNDSRVF